MILIDNRPRLTANLLNWLVFEFFIYRKLTDNILAYLTYLVNLCYTKFEKILIH